MDEIVQVWRSGGFEDFSERTGRKVSAAIKGADRRHGGPTAMRPEVRTGCH